MKKILLLVALALVVALPASAQTLICRSVARTACENCAIVGGDWLKSGCIELQFLTLSLNPKSGRYEGLGTVKVGGANANPSFTDNAAVFSVLIEGGVLADVQANGVIPSSGTPYAVVTTSITQDGPWYDVHLEAVTVPNRGQLRKFLDGASLDPNAKSR